MLGNHKAVVTVAQHLQAFLGGFAEWSFIQQHAVRGYRTTANPATQLVQLGQAKPLRVFYDHQAGVWYVDPHLNHRGGNQQLQFALLEGLHHCLFLR
ncbi:hypothetical protein D3C75_849820 [compost metagenome]